MSKETELEQIGQWLLRLVKLLLQKGGSDLIITAGSAPAISLDGRVVRIGDQKITQAQAQILVRSVMNDRQWARFEAHNEVDFALHYPNVARFRVNAFRQRGSSGMVLRMVPSRIPSFEELNLPLVLKDISMTRRGLVLFLGATGSGKSTSLAAIIDYRNENSPDHIITIEDPIEYFHTHKQSIVNQREVGIDTESYYVALRSALRQKPDVILIGEIRDRETMEHAIQISETGHLCLSTLHASSADQAFDRIINFFPEEKRGQLLMDLSFNMRAFVSQRLIPRASGNGQVPAVEVLLNTPLISKLIFEGRIKEIKGFMAKSGEPGMLTFDQALYDLFVSGKISYEQALRNADSVNDMRIRIRLSGLGPPSDFDDSQLEIHDENFGRAL